MTISGRNTPSTGAVITLVASGAVLAAGLVLIAASFLPHPSSYPLRTTADGTSDTSQHLPAVTPQVLHAQWVAGVHAALDGIGPNSTKAQIQAAESALLALRVASQDRDMHLALAMDLVALGQGTTDAAVDLQQRLDAVGK